MKFYQKTWFIVLMMICLPPLGWFLMFKFTDWSATVKKVLSIPLGIYTLFFVMVCIVAAVSPPATTTETPPTSISSSSEPSKPVANSKPAEIEKPVESKKPAEQPAPAQSNNSTPAASEKPVESPKEPNQQSQTVYYTKTGKKYHYENPCGKGTYYPCTLDEAIAKGLTPCEKCVN